MSFTFWRENLRDERQIPAQGMSQPPLMFSQETLGAIERITKACEIPISQAFVLHLPGRRIDPQFVNDTR